MRRSALRLLAVILLAMLLPALPISAAEGSAGVAVDQKPIWTSASDGGKYSRHRIPGIVVTKKDTVTIYCEARTGDTTYSLFDKNDWCLMDIYIQRSEDGGETFSEPIYIARGTPQCATVNNPVIIVGNDNTLHILYCKNYDHNGGGLWYRRSYDDGKTWTPEREVTDAIAGVPHLSAAFGPTHGICTREGVLMAPIWMSQPAHAYVFYSKDNGESWQLSEPGAQNTGETDIVQLSDGSILLNSRATPHRRITTSQTGIDGWSTTRIDTNLPDPSCCAGMVAVDLPGLPYAHLFTNCATTADRKNLTLRCSFDDCNTFSKEIVISRDYGGYSDVAVDSKGTVYVLYELNGGLRMNLARLSFFDAFCADEREVMTNSATRFDLRGAGASAMVSSHSGGTVEETAEGLRFTASAKSASRLTLDLSPVSKNINLSEFGAVAITVRLLAQNPDIREMMAEFRCGRQLFSAENAKASALCRGDGTECTLIFDLSSMQRRDGMLRSLQLKPEGSAPLAEGDVLLLSEIAFLASPEEALKNSEQKETASEERSSEPKQAGCGACLSPLVLLPPLAAGLLSSRKESLRKHPENRKCTHK